MIATSSHLAPRSSVSLLRAVRKSFLIGASLRWARVSQLTGRRRLSTGTRLIQTIHQQGSNMGKTAISSTAYLQVLGLGLDVGDSTPSVLLFFDHHRYLFNAGEGFQRFCVQHKLKLNRMTDILVTRASLDALGGVPGMVLTMSDAANFHNVSSGLGTVSSCRANIYGPKGVQHLANAMGSYIRMGGVDFHELPLPNPAAQLTSGTDNGVKANNHSSAAPVVKSDAVTISPVVLGASANVASSGKAAGEEEEAWLPNKRQRTDESASSGLQDQQQQQQQPPLPLAACYICQLGSIPGKFLPQKAKELGVPPGPLFGQLKAGNAVQGKGRMIQPHEVLEEAPPSPTVIIADCPTGQHLPSLLASPAWGPFTSGESAPQHANCVVHLTPAEVVRLPEYEAWVASFGKSTRHIMVNSAAVPGSYPLTSSATLQAKLNSISQTVFPIPQSNSPDKAKTAQHSNGGVAEAQTVNGTSPEARTVNGSKPESQTVGGSNLLKYHLRPASRVDHMEASQEPAFDAAAIQTELAQEMPEVLEAAKTAAAAEGIAAPSRQAVPDVIQQAGPEDLEVVFLGTGAALPSKYRNVTCIYINRFARGGLLLDCGEGSLGQLARRFGPSGVRHVVCSLACVWISHIHADHHAGLPRLLAARAEWMGPGCPPLPVFGPWPLERILQHTAALQAMPHIFFNQTGLVAKPQHQVSPEYEAAVAVVKAQLGLKTLQSVLVVHCAHAYAAVLEGEAGWKVVFSGDTRPCHQLVQAAKDATLLIHEATFEDDLIEDAKAKRHSLTCEAVEVGAKAGAYRTILTHFSQRYPKIPKIEKSFLASTCIAFDLMSINLQELPRLPLHVPAVTLLCKDVDEAADDKAEQ